MTKKGGKPYKVSSEEALGSAVDPLSRGQKAGLLVVVGLGQLTRVIAARAREVLHNQHHSLRLLCTRS